MQQGKYLLLLFSHLCQLFLNRDNGLSALFLQFCDARLDMICKVCVAACDRFDTLEDYVVDQVARIAKEISR
jgi:hypothetical protein